MVTMKIFKYFFLKFCIIQNYFTIFAVSSVSMADDRHNGKTLI